MSKLLNGSELAGYIKERQARQVRGLRQAWGVYPRLAVIKSTTATQVIDTYVRIKCRYGDDILIETVVETHDEIDMPAVIERLNADKTVHGIIVQLPLSNTDQTDEIVNRIHPAKDVDGLGRDATFTSATAEAINWLLAGYGVELGGKHLTIVGNGRLVGAPLAELWRNAGYDVTVLDDRSGDIAPVLLHSDVVVSATGVPCLIRTDMLGVGATVIDAGTASESGVIVGDIDPKVYEERDDLIITPAKGGVGPLTVAALFDHVITAARQTADNPPEPAN